jgi:glycosyltransferase involved in cell wall biosynthesis
MIMKSRNPKLRVMTIPNGVEVLDFQNGKHERGLVCLGKVEPRKRQVELVESLPDDFDVTFVGQIVDQRIGRLSESQRSKFIGPWSRDLVLENLSSYKGLVLLSEAEADALVLYEAQASGLQIFACDLALGAQNRDLPWVHEVELTDPNLASNLNEAISRTFTNDEIRDYALKNYSSEKSSALWLEFAMSLIRI